MKSLTISCLLAGCIALMILSGCAIDIAGSALPPPTNQPPTCHLEAQPSEILVGQSTTITCSANDVDGDAIYYDWHAPPGCTLEGGGTTRRAVPSHSGFFYVSVTVIDDDGDFTAGVTIGVRQRNAPDILWTRNVSTTLNLILSDVIMLPDGGYAAVGSEEYYNPYTSYRSIIAVTDADLRPLWTAEGARRTGFNALTQAHDGKFVVVGSIADCLAVWNNDIYVSCYTKSGVRESERQYGGDHWDEAYGILPVSDSTFVVLASGAIFGGMGLLWITEQGDTLRSRPVAGNTLTHDFACMPNGDIVVAGMLGGPYQPPILLSLTRVSAEGAVMWTKQYEGFDGISDVAVCPAPDGGVTIAVELDLIHTDASGRMLWRRSCYSGRGYGYTGFGDVLADERGYLLAGYDENTFMFRNGTFLLRTDHEGNLVWYHTENNFEGADKILHQPDGSLIVLHGRESLTKFAAE